MTLLQASSTGRPVITCDVAGCRELVNDHETGLVVPPRSAQALTQAILELVDSPSLCCRLGEKARIRVENEFSDKVVNKATLDLYRQVERE